MTKKKKKSPWIVFVAIILAAIVGMWTGTESQIFGIRFYAIYDLLGTLFIRALTLVVVPLVASSIITGVARIGGDENFGRLGIKIFVFYIGTTFLAVIVGLLVVNLIQPGISMADKIATLSTESMAHLEETKIGFTDIIMEFVPSNAFLAFSQGQMLGIIFFSLFFGYAVSKVVSDAGTTVLNFFQGIFDAMIQLTHLIMKCLPLGVFCLVAKTFATAGIETFHSLALFTLTVLLALGLFSLVVLPLLIRTIGKRSPLTHFRAMAPALVTAFSTSSSSATLPITIDCVEKRAGVSNRICSLVVPLGTSMNMSGSALYECVAALFVAQAYGLDMTLATQFIVVVLALLTSLGVAGIPAASLVSIIIILKTIGLPSEGIGLFLAVDRLLDMCRTTVNVFSDSCCAVLVARSEGESNILTQKDFPSF